MPFCIQPACHTWQAIEDNLIDRDHTMEEQLTDEFKQMKNLKPFFEQITIPLKYM
jgi:hypothetical protein